MPALEHDGTGASVEQERVFHSSRLTRRWKTQIKPLLLRTNYKADYRPSNQVLITVLLIGAIGRLRLFEPCAQPLDLARPERALWPNPCNARLTGSNPTCSSQSC